MNTFKDIVDMFLNIIREIDYVDYTQEELELELSIKLKMVVSKARVIKDLVYDPTLGELSRDISDMEATILAHGLAVEWLSPKVYNWELLETQVSSKDFTIYSNSNRMSEMRNLRNDCKIEFHNLISDYDLDGFLDGIE